MVYLITGGCGFIGSNFGDMILSNNHNAKIINIDKRTNISNAFLLSKYTDKSQYLELTSDISETDWINVIDKPDVVIHFAAESHVDKSLTDLNTFIASNITGTANVAAFCIKRHIPMIYVSTDEVYGELTLNDPPFKEDNILNPRNPYSVTKASGELILKALSNANPELRYIITRCSNNFGPQQDKSKFIPVCINAILNDKKIPVYGAGDQIRDWIHVKDHCAAIWQLSKLLLADQIKCGEIFNIGADNEHTNLSLVHKICSIMDKNPDNVISFMLDPRKNAHDFRYAIDSSKLKEYINWNASNTHPFDETLKETIDWYGMN